LEFVDQRFDFTAKDVVDFEGDFHVKWDAVILLQQL
jgi:hypothetical protein